MIKRNRGKARNRISALSIFVVFCIVFSMFSTWIGVNPAHAQTARAAIVVEVNGDVSVKKAGGSKSYTAYEEMSLNQGDMISTGEGSSLVLKIADHDDEMTIGENAEVYISDLVNQGNGKVSKFKLWAGSAWTKVKSLVSSEDEFEVETPTAVMGVRGTLLFSSVNPTTGETTLAVGSGVVRATTIAPSSTGGQGPSSQVSKYVTVYPSQQLTTDNRAEDTDLRVKVDTVNISDIVQLASPKVLEAMIKNTKETQQENEEIRQRLIEDLNKGIQKPEPQSILKIKDLDDLNKVAKNFDAFIPNLAKQAIDAKKVNQKVIDDANEKIEDPLKKLDLTKVNPLDKQAGSDPEVEQLKQQAKQQDLKYVSELQLIQSNQDKLRELLQKIESERSKIEAANKQQIADQNKAILDQYLSQLSQEQRKQFEEAQKKNNGSDSVSSTPVASGGGGHKGSGNGSNQSSTPTVPVLVSPTTGITTNSPVIVVKAPANNVIKVLNNGTVIAQANGNGDQEVHIPLSSLVVEGTVVYDRLSIITELNGNISAAVAIPAITVDTQMGIFLTSAVKENQTVTAQLIMKNFKDTKGLYAAEVHLMYDHRLSYKGNGDVARDPGTVFGAQPQSVEVVKETKIGTNAELTYAATGHLPAGDSSNFEIEGEQPLVSIPLTLSDTDTNTDTSNLNVKLVYYKVVDSEGNVVTEFDAMSAPVEVPVK